MEHHMRNVSTTKFFRDVDLLQSPERRKGFPEKRKSFFFGKKGKIAISGSPVVKLFASCQSIFRITPVGSNNFSSGTKTGNYENGMLLKRETRRQVLTPRARNQF
jgi:hypothetical protein